MPGEGSPRIEGAPVVWTVGHSNRTLEELVALLRQHWIEFVADVRRYPASRRHPHFAKDELRLALPRAAIAYEHLVELGGHREPRPDSPHRALPPGPFRGYADHMGTPEFARARARLLDLARTRRVAALCAEARPEHCHRRLLADALLAAGATVRHLIADEGEVDHVLHSSACVHDGGVVYSRVDQPSLFD